MTANSLAKRSGSISFHNMQSFAKILMFLALTLQGLMPAMAMPTAASGHGAKHSHMMEAASVVAHPHEAAAHKVHSPQQDNTWHCPLMPASCTMACCIACTALPPPIMSGAGPIAAPNLPARALMSPMSDETPRPLVPPPRA